MQDRHGWTAAQIATDLVVVSPLSARDFARQTQLLMGLRCHRSCTLSRHTATHGRESILHHSETAMSHEIPARRASIVRGSHGDAAMIPGAPGIYRDRPQCRSANVSGRSICTLAHHSNSRNATVGVPSRANCPLDGLPGFPAAVSAGRETPPVDSPPAGAYSDSRAARCWHRRQTHVPVAQLDRASASGAEGCRFESCRG